MTDLAIFLGASLTLWCGLLVLLRIFSVRRITLLDWSLMAIGGMYGMGWILVVYATSIGQNPTWVHWIEPFGPLYPIHTAASFILVFSVVSGWYLLSPFFRLRPYCGQNADPVSYDQLRPWTRAFWSMLLLALISQWLYAYAYGGLLESLEYSSRIRSALFDDVPDNPFSFLRPFGGLAFLASFGFFGIWMSRSGGVSVRLGLALSLFFSLYVLYSWLGRLGFIIFVMTFFLGWVFFKNTGPVRILLIGGISFIAILLSAYGVSVALDLKASDALFSFLAGELSFPFASFFAQVSSGLNHFRGLYDFVLVPIYFLPSSLWTAWVQTAEQVNTAMIMGAPKGWSGVTGGIPVDLLTLGFMQFSILGVFVVGLMFGGLLRMIQWMLDRIPIRGIRVTLEAHLALKIAVLGVFYAQPDLFVSGNFYLFFGLFIVLLYLWLGRIRILIHDRGTKKLTPVAGVQ